MKRAIVLVFSFLLLNPPFSTAQEPKSGQSVADQFKSLVERVEVEGQPREFAGDFIELAITHSKDPVAVEALIWVVTNVRRGSELERAMELLGTVHIEDEGLEPLFQVLAQKPSLSAEKLLREAIEKSPHREVQAQACYHLTIYLKEQARLLQSLNEQTDRRRFEQYYGKDFTKKLASLEEEKLNQEIEQLYQCIIKSFADVAASDEECMGERSTKALFAMQHLSLGKQAPEVRGEDIDGTVFSLSDYRGKVVLLDFWGHW